MHTPKTGQPQGEIEIAIRGLAEDCSAWIRNRDMATKDVLLEDGLSRVLTEQLAPLLRQGDDAAFERHVEAYARGSDSHRQATFASCTNPSCVMYRAAFAKLTGRTP